ncbi:CREB/ATF bZIP transcription factor-like isoform X2 [Frankliniella occidentalis]|uniref:CREB/ATF bZIP transcription factor-like isoform X2 n=1 Tax=Frankliniella occidentalis TaxID=133901 RepID=A0A9C6X1I9_FRAOC|nr:CREB/ATF bZIP transcription factor-like isoform X2 [Frankliniella occidentalis]
MARFASGASGRLGKRTRNASETASLSSWGSEINVLSDVEEDNFEVQKKRRFLDSGVSMDAELSGRAFTSSDEESQQQPNSSATRGKRPKCFSRNAVLARQNRLKKKKYMADLENELQALRRENSKLKLSLDGYSKDVQLVRKENKYLRNVLANNSSLIDFHPARTVRRDFPIAVDDVPLSLSAPEDEDTDDLDILFGAFTVLFGRLAVLPSDCRGYC